MLAEKFDNEEENGQLSLDSSVRNIAYWESSLFSTVYLNNDLKRDFSEKWDRDYDDQVFDENGDSKKSGFYHFYNEFRNIANRLRSVGKANISETDTINKIIAPVLDALGWYDNCNVKGEEPFPGETSFTVKENGKNKTYRTDLLLVDHPTEADFINSQTDAEKRKREARQHCIAPLEAKYWNRIPDKEKSKAKENRNRADKSADDTSASNSFNEQVLNYMDILHKRWGIITDGNTWRLVNNQISSEQTSRCFEFKLESLLDQEQKIEAGEADDTEFIENAKYFYLFFGKPSFIEDDTGKVFLDEVLKESRKYIDNIEEDLKDRFISAMNYTCDSLLASAKDKGTIKGEPSDDELNLIRAVAESHLFNILFIKSCEARGVLPIKSPEYYKISLTSIIDRISVFDPNNFGTSNGRNYINMRLGKSLKVFKYSPDTNTLYKNLIKLTGVIHGGAQKNDHFGFEIEGFKESVFSKKEWAFAKKHEIKNEEMVKILFQLGYSQATQSIQKNYQQIPYNYFTPRQLGSIYESFLEFKIAIADEKMAYVKKGKGHQWVKVTANVERKLKGHEPIAHPGHIFFTPDNADRKASGSYYTPDYIVQKIVRDNLRSSTRGATSKEILKLKICDPAMGSGHFLIGALNYLTTQYLKSLEGEVASDKLPTKEEAKRIVLDKCIYGVDINPRAVKLAKMSLWLESAHWGKKLEQLDDQLYQSDYLKWEPQAKMDFYLGNPPYFNVDDTFGNGHPYLFFLRNEYPQIYNDKTDIYYYIMGKALSEAAQGVSFIISRAFLEASKAENLRKYLSNNGSIDTVIDFRGFNIFDVGITTAILTMKKSRTAKEKATFYKLDDDTITVEELIDDLKGEYRNFESGEFNLTEVVDGNWRMVSNIDEVLVSTMEKNTTPLGSIDKYFIGKGMETGANGVFQVKSEELNDFKDAKKYLKKRARNSLIGKYNLAQEKDYLIYIENLSSFDKLPKSIQKRLKSGEDKLKNRAAFKRGDCDWFRYTWPLHKDKMNLPRITCPFYCSESRFAFDNNFEWIGSTDTYSVFSMNDSLEDIYFVQGILNSEVIDFWYKKVAKLKSKDIYEYVENSLSKVPIPNKPDTKIRKEIVRLVKSANSSPTQSILKEIEGYVCDLYGISGKLKSKFVNIAGKGLAEDGPALAA